MIRKIYNVNEPPLRKKSREVGRVDKKTKRLIEDMRDTLAAQADPEGVGLAAPQIGKNLRIFLVKFEGTERVVINPKVIEVSKPVKAAKRRTKDKPLEGCLSLPHYYGPIRRGSKITIEYLDENGKKQVETFRGFLAQIVQHELDHLDGVIFVDRILEQSAPLYKFNGDEWEEVDLL